MTADRGEAPTNIRERAQKLLAADHFAALALPRTASAEDAKKAFIEAAKTWHPDRLPPGSEDLRATVAKVFARLELARNILSDPARRARYVEELTRPAAAGDLSAAEAALEMKKAEALLKKNDVAGSEQHLRRAVQLAPENATYQAALVSLRIKPTSSNEELQRAVAELDRLIARDGRCERAFFVRAGLRKRLDRGKEAIQDYARAAELNPNNLDAVREVRIHRMRQQRAGVRDDSGPAETEKDAGPADGGAMGFLRKLFKR